MKIKDKTIEPYEYKFENLKIGDAFKTSDCIENEFMIKIPEQTVLSQCDKERYEIPINAICVKANKEIFLVSSDPQVDVKKVDLEIEIIPTTEFNFQNVVLGKIDYNTFIKQNFEIEMRIK